jgi:hypothetical protein
MKKATPGEINLAITIKESSDETRTKEPEKEELEKLQPINAEDAVEWTPEPEPAA